MPAVALDREGYLRDLRAWSEQVATDLAEREGMDLTDAHWELIWLVRAFFKRFEVSPEMRVLVKQVRNQLGEDKGNSIYLMHTFGQSPAKMLAKIAGLPRPTNCL